MGDKDIFAPGAFLKKFFHIEDRDKSTVLVAIFFTFIYLLLIRLQLIYGYNSSDDFVYLAFPEKLSQIFIESGRFIPGLFAKLILALGGSPISVGFILKIIELFVFSGFVIIFCYSIHRLASKEINRKLFIITAFIPASYPLLLDHYSFMTNAPARIFEYLLCLAYLSCTIKRNYVLSGVVVLLSAFNYEGGLSLSIIIAFSMLALEQIKRFDTGEKPQFQKVFDFAMAGALALVAYYLIRTVLFPFCWKLAYGAAFFPHTRDALRPLLSLPHSFIDYVLFTTRQFGNQPFSILPPGPLVLWGVLISFSVFTFSKIKSGKTLTVKSFLLYSAFFFGLFILSGNFYSIIFDTPALYARASDQFGFTLAVFILVCGGGLAKFPRAKTVLCAASCWIAILYTLSSAKCVYDTKMYYDQEMLAAAIIVGNLSQLESYVPGVTRVAIEGRRADERRSLFSSELHPFLTGGLDGRLTRYWSKLLLLDFVAGYPLQPATDSEAETAKHYCTAKIAAADRNPYFVGSVSKELAVVCLESYKEPKKSRRR